VFDECFSQIFDRLSRQRRLIGGLTIAVVVATGIGLQWIVLENDIQLMLPGDEEIRRSMRFLQESHLSDNVIISLELKSPDAAPGDLAQAVGQLEARLGPPLVTKVLSGVSGVDVAGEMLSFLKYLPQLIDEQALLRIADQLTPEGVKESLSRNYRQLLSPASTFMVPFVRADPLGIGSDTLRSLQSLSSSMGYDIEIEGGRFVSRDRTHAMLVIQTAIAVTDVAGARELISYLRERVAELPDYVSADIIAGHLHSISNEDVIKRDIWLTLSIAGVAFLLLFLLLFRDVRAIALFVIPLVSVLIAINLANVVLSRLSYFIVGMGGVVAGIAVDYGIHVYMAVRSANGREDAVKLVAKPVVTGAITTLGVFAAFFFSSVQGYHQLALFSILSIVLCLGCALFVLPHFLSRPHGVLAAEMPGQGDFERAQGQSRLIIGCWVLALVAALVSSRDLSFDSDIRQFDGSEPYVLQAEKDFHRVWGGEEQPAVFVVAGESLERALRRNKQVYRDAVALMGEGEFSNLSSIWPLEEERAANAARWSDFWRRGREAELRRLLEQEGAAYSFSDDAFSPFFENLYADPGIEGALEDLGIFSTLRERFVQESQGGYQVLSFFPDEERFVSRLSALSAHHPDTLLVSRNALSQALSRSVSSEIVYLSAIAAILIPMLACLLLRDIRLTALALVPVLSGIMAVLGVIPVLGLFLNAPSVISAMVVVGLCIDYGIFVVYACHRRLETGTRTAVTLSAVTTLIGTGVLLFARHPILFSIGVTMATGVLAGYLSSILVVPCLYRRFVREGIEA
jgi:predicted exporter